MLDHHSSDSAATSDTVGSARRPAANRTCGPLCCLGATFSERPFAVSIRWHDTDYALPLRSRCAAPRPTARPAKAILQLLLSPANTAFSGHLLLGILDPADELVAGERRDVLPGMECRGVADQRTAQIPWKLVDHAARHALAAHPANPMPTRSSTSQSAERTRAASVHLCPAEPSPFSARSASTSASKVAAIQAGTLVPRMSAPASAPRIRAARIRVSQGAAM